MQVLSELLWQNDSCIHGGGRRSSVSEPPEFPWLATGGSLTLDHQPPIAPFFVASHENQMPGLLQGPQCPRLGSWEGDQMPLRQATEGTGPGRDVETCARPRLALVQREYELAQARPPHRGGRLPDPAVSIRRCSTS